MPLNSSAISPIAGCAMSEFLSVRALRRPSSIDLGGETQVEQCHKNEANINNIVGKYNKTGLLPQAGGAFYGDVTNVESYSDCVDCLRRSEEYFESLPAIVRKRFRNSPEELCDFLLDAKNRDEAVKLGLLRPEAELAPPVVEAPSEGVSEPVK